MGPEAGLRARIRNAIRHTPGTVVWGWPASAFSGAGHPDLFGLTWGRFWGLEVKTSTGRPTQRQLLALRAIRRAGGYAWIVRTVQQATKAMAYIQEGKHPPMATDPFDVDDFFKSLDEQTPGVAGSPADIAANEALADVLLPDGEPEGEDVFASLDEPLSIQAEATADQDAFDLATGTATREEKLQALDERDDALNAKLEEAYNGRKPTVSDIVAAREAGVFEAETSDEEDLVKALNMIAQFSEKLDKDVRAVGDRLTTVFEEINSLRLEMNVTRNIAQAQEKATRQLISLINEDDAELPEVPIMPEPEPTPIAPARRSSRRRSS